MWSRLPLYSENFAALPPHFLTSRRLTRNDYDNDEEWDAAVAKTAVEHAISLCFLSFVECAALNFRLKYLDVLLHRWSPLRQHPMFAMNKELVYVSSTSLVMTYSKARGAGRENEISYGVTSRRQSVHSQ